MQIFVSAKEIKKKYGISYARINYLTKKGVFAVEKKIGNKRLYSLEEIDREIELIYKQ
jgi:DNA-binding transcriptional MerR regulator